MDYLPEHIWLLIARKLSGEATVEELQELEGLLRENPGAGYSREVLSDLWQSQPQQDRLYAENRYKELVQQIKNKGLDEGRFAEGGHIINNSEEEWPAKSSKKKWVVAFSLAAVIIATAASIYFFAGSSNTANYPDNEQAKNQISTKNGSKTSLVLPDGTKVWLNAGSQLDYDKNYGNKIREVSLVGEAYFDVMKNPERPFLIHTRKMDIKVLGTAFNVKCYPGEKTTETSLVHGSIEVTLKDRQEKIMLKPYEKLILNNDDNSITGSKSKPAKIDAASSQNEKPIISVSRLTYMPADSTVIETAWVQNRLVFSSETFEEVAMKMERWYNVKINFADEAARQYRLTGNFEKETTLEALNALKLVAPFVYTLKNNEVVIYRGNAPRK